MPGPEPSIHTLNEKKIRLALILDTLKREGRVEVRLKGSCMWPIVLDGDFLTLETFPFHKLRLGDVAVFQISEELLHVNTRFAFRAPRPSQPAPENYIGRVHSLNRKDKIHPIANRPFILKLLQILISPANPWFRRLRQILKQAFGRKTRSPEIGVKGF